MSVEFQWQEPIEMEDVQQSITATRRFRSCALPVTPLGERIATIASIAVAGLGIWMLVGQDATISRMNYNIDHLQSQVQNMDINNSSLRAEVDKLKEPNRILSIALNQLHMQLAPAVPLNTQTPSNP